MTAGALALIAHLVAGPAVLIGAALGAVGLAGPLVLLKVLGVAVNVFILGRMRSAARAPVMMVRRKLGDPPVVETVPGAGYRIP